MQLTARNYFSVIIHQIVTFSKCIASFSFSKLVLGAFFLLHCGDNVCTYFMDVGHFSYFMVSLSLGTTPSENWKEDQIG